MKTRNQSPGHHQEYDAQDRAGMPQQESDSVYVSIPQVQEKAKFLIFRISQKQAG
jgi:hypothetical protein